MKTAKAPKMKRVSDSLSLIAATLMLPLSVLSATLPYQNPDLTPEARAEDLIARLTLREKATLMCDVSDAIPRLNIKDV